jgi:sortase (surface protein transpeptidase)
MAPVPAAGAIPRTTPTRILIPAIGVDAAITPEGTGAGGALNMPPLTAENLAAWWDGGSAPGQDGPAVIAGHVDSAQAGPLVFWRLGQLVPGDTVTVDPAGVTFTVTRVTQVTKEAFPTQLVYGATKDPELRLITCGGTFDPATGHYLSNVIVYAKEI